MVDANLKIINDLKLFIQSSKSKRSYFKEESAFTRARKLDFEKLVVLIVNMLKRSLSIELQAFFEINGQTNSLCTKSAFTQQRMKLSNHFFAAWNVVMVDSFYKHYKKSIKRWKGFRVIAIDGSTAYLMDKPELREYFGVQVNQSCSVVMGQIMTAYDVLNDITIAAQLYPIEYSEQQIINRWTEYYEPDMLYLYDRGFPSFASIFLHLNQERPIRFVMRCRSNFNNETKAFIASNRRSQIVVLTPSDDAIKQLYLLGYGVTKDTQLKIRFVKVELDTGETEILITNLYSERKFPARIFKRLYFMRWGIETNYDFQKNVLQLESFSGHKPETVLQDFHANIFVANLHSIIVRKCEPKIKAITKHRKLKYKINKNVTIGLFKNRIVNIFLDESPQKILEELEALFIRHLEPIRPNRMYKRKKKTKRLNGKYQTFSNYKRAI